LDSGNQVVAAAGATKRIRSTSGKFLVAFLV
jgi:hypothetical protein